MCLESTVSCECFEREFVVVVSCFEFVLCHTNSKHLHDTVLSKFDILTETSKFAFEASLLGQIFVLRTSNFRGETISR